MHLMNESQISPQCFKQWYASAVRPDGTMTIINKKMQHPASSSFTRRLAVLFYGAVHPRDIEPSNPHVVNFFPTHVCNIAMFIGSFGNTLHSVVGPGSAIIPFIDGIDTSFRVPCTVRNDVLSSCQSPPFE